MSSISTGVIRLKDPLKGNFYYGFVLKDQENVNIKCKNKLTIENVYKQKLKTELKNVKLLKESDLNGRIFLHDFLIFLRNKNYHLVSKGCNKKNHSSKNHWLDT